MQFIKYSPCVIFFLASDPHLALSLKMKYEKVSLCLSYVHVRLLHLLARHLLQLRRRRRAAREYAESVTVFQGQLQQLIHLHGTSVHNAFIDALQVFQGQVQQLIHLHVIDALPVFLSHSTCPLCRRSLLAPSELSPTCSPAGLVFESESSHDMAESARHGAAGGEPSAMAVRVLVPEGAKEVAVRVPAFSRARHGGMSEREASYHFFFLKLGQLPFRLYMARTTPAAQKRRILPKTMLGKDNFSVHKICLTRDGCIHGDVRMERWICLIWRPVIAHVSLVHSIQILHWSFVCTHMTGAGRESSCCWLMQKCSHPDMLFKVSSHSLSVMESE